MKQFIILTALIFICILTNKASALPFCDFADPSIEKCQIKFNNGLGQVHFYKTNQSCDLVILGIGTAMNIDEYDTLSLEISKNQNIAIIDHNPGWPFKTDATKFASMVKKLILDWKIHTKSLNENNCKIIVGGHSASGQAAHEALSNLSYQINDVDGIFSLDPYDIRSQKKDIINIPGLYFGFNIATITPKDAAKTAFDKTTHAIFYEIQTANPDLTKGEFTPIYHHCSFADDRKCGYSIFSSPKETPEIYTFVADKLNEFLVYLKNKKDFEQIPSDVNNGLDGKLPPYKKFTK